jgi:hypothetical protein
MPSGEQAYNFLEFAKFIEAKIRHELKNKTSEDSSGNVTEDG